MDTFITSFTLSVGPALPAPRDSATTTLPADARAVGSRAGLASASLAPGGPCSSVVPGAERPAFRDDAPIDGEPLAVNPPRLRGGDVKDVVQSVCARAMSLWSCVVTATPVDTAVDHPSGAAPTQRFSSPMSQSPTSAPLDTDARVSGQSGVPVPLAPAQRFNFTVCGVVDQVKDTRSTLLEHLPLMWQVALYIPPADVVDADAPASAFGTALLKTEVQMRLDDIMTKSGTYIHVSEPDAPSAELAGGFQVDRSLKFVLSGGIESIEYARIQVLVALDELAGLQTETLTVDRKLAHAISGRKRSMLQSIEQESGANVYMPSMFTRTYGGSTFPAVTMARDKVFITGTAPKVKCARELLLLQLSQKAKALVVQRVQLLPLKLDWLLLERREDLRALMYDNSSYLELPAIGRQDSRVAIYGLSRVDVERSVRTLMQLVAPYYSMRVWLLPGTYDAFGLSSKVDKRLVASVASSVSAASGAEVVFHNNAFDLNGTDVEVRNALRHFMRVPSVKHYVPELRFRLELATDHREFISGKKNGKINKIMENCGVRIRFEPFNEYNFWIDVLARELDAALQGLGQLQEELPAEMSFHVPEAYHKRIIGVGGKNIQRIMKKFGVYVKFSNADEFAALGGYVDNDDNVIARTPSKNAANLENLKQSVMELVSPKDKDFVTATVMVPRRFHRMLLHDRSSALREIEQKTRCVLRFARTETGLDTLLIFGPETQIALAIPMVLQLVPLEAELAFVASPELDAFLDSSDYVHLVERIQRELGSALTVKRTPKDVIFCANMNRANMELLTVARAMLDELLAKYSVQTRLATAGLNAPPAPAPISTLATSTYSPPALPPFSTSRFSPPKADVVATADTLSASPVHTRLDDPPTSTSPQGLKALFNQSSPPSSMTFDAPGSNTPLMSPFYTSGYADSSGLSSHGVWGAPPLPSIPDVGATHTGKSSVFSPFSAGPIPFQFSPTDAPLAPDTARGASAPFRRTDAIGSVPVDMGAFTTHPLGRSPLGVHSGPDRGADLNGFSPLSEPAPGAGISMMTPSAPVPPHRSGSLGIPRNAGSASSPSDTMDEVSRVLAQIGFDKQ